MMGLRLSGRIWACLLATWVVWGSTYLAIKYALLSFPPFFQMGTRFLAAGVALLAYTCWRGRALPTRLEWRNAFIAGALMLGGGMGGTAYAEMSVGSGLVVAFIAVIPVMIAALNLFWGELPSKAEAAGIAFGLSGVLMLTQGQGFGASPEGLIAITLACLTWCVGTVWTQRGLPLAPGAVGFASEMICGGAVLMAMSWAWGETPTWPPQGLAVGAWVYLVIAGSLIAFNAYMVLAAEAPALASTYSFVNPVIALLLGVWVAGEVVSRYEWMAAGVILMGVVLMLWGTRPQSKANSPSRGGKAPLHDQPELEH